MILIYITKTPLNVLHGMAHWAHFTASSQQEATAWMVVSIDLPIIHPFNVGIVLFFCKRRNGRNYATTSWWHTPQTSDILFIWFGCHVINLSKAPQVRTAHPSCVQGAEICRLGGVLVLNHSGHVWSCSTYTLRNVWTQTHSTLGNDGPHHLKLGG